MMFFKILSERFNTKKYDIFVAKIIYKRGGERNSQFRSVIRHFVLNEYGDFFK